MKKGLIIGFILVIFVISLAIGYYINSNKDNKLTSYTYLGPLGTFNFTVSDKGDHWLSWYSRTLIKGNIYNAQDWKTPFPYGPIELSDVSIPKINPPRPLIRSARDLYLTRDVYLDEKYQDINPTGGMVISLLSVQRVVDKFHVNATLAAIEENELSRELELPVINCDDANKDNIVIWFKEGDENAIYPDKNNGYCIVAEFKEGEDPARVATALDYNIIGVM